MSNFQTIAALMSKAPIRHEDCMTFQVGNIVAKVMELPERGMAVIQHAHHYDHMTLIARGSVRVSSEEHEGTRWNDYEAPAFVEVKAHTHHAITALEDNTLAYCIHDVTGLDLDDLGVPFKGN